LPPDVRRRHEPRNEMHTHRRTVPRGRRLHEPLSSRPEQPGLSARREVRAVERRPDDGHVRRNRRQPSLRHCRGLSDYEILHGQSGALRRQQQHFLRILVRYGRLLHRRRRPRALPRVGHVRYRASRVRSHASRGPDRDVWKPEPHTVHLRSDHVRWRTLRRRRHRLQRRVPSGQMHFDVLRMPVALA
jgi:hypothetical protein